MFAHMSIFAHMNKTDLIGSAEAAQILGVDRATFNRWAVKGLISTAFKAPGYTGPRLFDRKEIERSAKERAA